MKWLCLTVFSIDDAEDVALILVIYNQPDQSCFSKESDGACAFPDCQYFMKTLRCKYMIGNYAIFCKQGRALVLHLFTASTSDKVSSYY